jgi:hypothetical protein
MKIINRIAITLIAVACYSCDDIIEKDITDSRVTTNYPQNNQQIESNVATFQWEKISGADNYRLQIYASSQNMILDSLVGGSSFTYPLNHGSYQWRIRGENSAYETSYTFPMTFTMIASDDLTTQQVQLLAPANSVFTADTSITLSWEILEAAESYSLQLLKNGGLIHSETALTTTVYNVASSLTAEDAQYTWKVKAVNSNGESAFSSRNFTIDRTAPNLPVNISPPDNATANLNTDVTFTWTAPSETGATGSPISYTLQIATSQNFTNIVHTATTSTTTLPYTFTSAGTYYWRVKASDALGNQGAYNNSYKIQIN